MIEDDFKTGDRVAFRHSEDQHVRGTVVAPEGPVHRDILAKCVCVLIDECKKPIFFEKARVRRLSTLEQLAEET